MRYFCNLTVRKSGSMNQSGEKDCSKPKRRRSSIVGKPDWAWFLVMTLVPQVNTNNIGETIDFMLERLPHIRGLHFQPVSYFGRYPKRTDLPIHFTISDLLTEIMLQTGGAYFRE